MTLRFTVKKQHEIIDNKHGIFIIFLPPYSPELNPIEHFWNLLKKKITDSVPYFQKFDDVIYSIFKVL
ncbi:MAG: transposase [Synergistaceae bacterium]|nr:transposase [Synergistaceae bacterium]